MNQIVQFRRTINSQTLNLVQQVDEIEIGVPITICNVRWSFKAVGESPAFDSALYWAIVVLREGNGLPILSLDDRTDFMSPAANEILACGVICTQDGGEHHGEAKGKRKIKSGDSIALIWNSTGNDETSTCFQGIWRAVMQH